MTGLVSFCTIIRNMYSIIKSYNYSFGVTILLDLLIYFILCASQAYLIPMKFRRVN